jgi:hypothetical protein
LALQADLVAPDGVVLDSSLQNTPKDDPNGIYLAAFLPDNGIYLLRLSGENNSTGDFVLALLGRAAVTPTPLTFGQAVEVTIPQNPTPQFFSFEAQDCPTTLIVTNPNPGQPFSYPFLLKVRDQRGQTVALLRGGEQTEDWVTVQPRSGTYEVEVSSTDPALAGVISLLVTCSGDNPGCPAGQIGLSAGTETCLPCFTPGGPNDGGGCPDLGLTITTDGRDPHLLTASWDPLPGAEGYAVYVYGYVLSGESLSTVYLTHATWIPGDPTAFSWVLPAEGYVGFRFELQVLAGGTVICSQSAEIMLEQPPDQHQNDLPCEISTQRRDVPVRVGPGFDRGIFDFLPPNENIRVVSTIQDADGNIWWEIDKTQIPGGAAAASLWVAAGDVVASGDCDNLPEGEIPPLIPGEEQPELPGGWLPCGSCDTCGHPANECVTSPEGACLWDPATCAPPVSGECHAIRVTVDYTRCPNTTASAMLDTVPNCETSRYSPGTTVQAHAVAVNPKCNVDYWSGCGASGGDNSITFTANSSCTLTAHMHYGN